MYDMAGDVQRFYIESSKTNTPESLRGTTYKSPPSAIPAEVGKIWICEPPDGQFLPAHYYELTGEYVERKVPKLRGSIPRFEKFVPVIYWFSNRAADQADSTAVDPATPLDV